MDLRDRLTRRPGSRPVQLIHPILRPAAAALVCAAALLVVEPAASRGSAAAPPGALEVAELPETPAGFDTAPRAAIRAANRDPKVLDQRRRNERLEVRVKADPPARWEVGYWAADDEVARVLVDQASGEVRESWTGYQVAWRMARGYEGQFGHALNAPYVWIPLSALFLLALIDWRRPLRVVHLDLAVLLSFGVSLYFFNRGEIGVSAPLAYPPLIYLLARLLWIGVRGLRLGLRPSLAPHWLAIGLLFLVGFRVALNVADSGVIDVGYAGVVGADRIADAEPIYGDGAFPSDNPSGDTYGPAAYYAYVPFEQALPWSGAWDRLAAAHAAAIAFDLATIVGLLVLGRVLIAANRTTPTAGGRGAAVRRITTRWAPGIVLAFAWVACPFTGYVLQSNSNDALVSGLLVWSLVVFASPLARGALLALAVMTKFAPLALVPLYAAGKRGWALLERQASAGSRGPLRAAPAAFAVVFCAVVALMLAHPAIDPGLATFWERTIANQADRESPFSIWGQTDLGGVRIVVALAAAALVLALAFVPRRRTLAQIAALSAAALIAAQLTVEHWFYLYIPWFLPGLLVALLAAEGRGGAVTRPDARRPA